MAASWQLAIAVCVLYSLYSCNCLETTAMDPVYLCTVPGYDVNNLTLASYWNFKKPNSCFPKDMSDTSCDFYLAFCRGLNSTGSPFNETCNGAGSCLMANQISYDIGEYSEGQENQFHEKTDGTGFYYSFPDGQAMENCSVTHTLMNFNCDKNNPWIPKDDGPTEIPGTVILEILNQTCVYNITVTYKGACLQSPQTSSSGLSIGSILLIIFIPTAALYFIIGIGINKYQGHQGEELLPHHEFWTSLPGNVSEGMKYAWACVTCRNTGGKEGGYESI